MNKTTKTILIVIVVAVAGFVLWKRSKGETIYAATGDITPSGNGGSGGVDINSTDAIIAALNLGAADSHKKYFHSYCEKYKAWQQSKDEIQRKATQNGLTWAQQAVIDAAYMTYYELKDGKWQPKYGGAAQQMQTVSEQVHAMSLN